MPRSFHPVRVALEVCNLYAVNLLHLLALHAEKHRFRICLHSEETITRDNHALLDSSPDLIGLPKSSVLVCRMNHRFKLNWLHCDHPWTNTEPSDLLLTVLPVSERRLAEIENRPPKVWLHVDTETGVIRSRSELDHLASFELENPGASAPFHPSQRAVDLLHGLPRIFPNKP